MEYGLDTTRGVPTPREIRGFPLISDHAEELAEFTANPQQRIPFGIRELDKIVLGPAAGEVATLVGRSFTGKSMMATNMMRNNPLSGIVFFSLEMPGRQVLQRLYSHVFDAPAHDVSRGIQANTLPSQLNELAGRLPNQVVIDDSQITLDSMSGYLERYETYFGERPSLAIMDYLEEIGGSKSSGEGMAAVEATASNVKAWAKDENMAVFLIHQANQKTEPWEPIYASSARFAGYTESDLVMGLWTPGTNPELSQAVAHMQRNHVYLNVVKNRITGELAREIRCAFDPALRIVSLQPHLSPLVHEANLRIVPE